MSQAVFTMQPTNALSGAVIAPAVRVELQDDGGALLAGATDPVQVILLWDVSLTPPLGGVLGGTVTRTAEGGVATFDDLVVTTSVPGPYALLSFAAGYVSRTSRQFQVSAALGTPTMFEAALVELAAADSPLGALIGSRFYPVDEAPQNGTLPYVTYTLIDHPSVHAMGRDSLAQPRVQFDCFADTRTQARAVCRAVVAAFDRAVWAVGNCRVISAVCENRGMDVDREDTTLRPRCLAEFVFTYELN